MIQPYKDSLDMFRREYKYVKTDTIAVSGTRPGLITGIDKLKTLSIDPIDAANVKFTALLKGYEANKLSKRNSLDSLLYSVTSGTYSYATSIGNLILQGQMKYPMTTIQAITDETIVDTVNNIMSIVNPIVALPVNPLADYGVDATLMNALKDARDAFAAAESEPEEMIQQRKAYAQTIKDKIRLGRDILLHEVDPAANTLLLTQKEWWNGYHNERVNISTGHHYNLIEGFVYKALVPAAGGSGGTGTTAAPVKEGIYGVTVLATHENGKVYTTKTDADGHYKLQKIMQGTFSSIKFMLDGYNEADFGAFKLTRGHVVEKDVYLTLTSGHPVIS